MQCIHMSSSTTPLLTKFISTNLTKYNLHFTGRGIYILYEDVKSCPYEDVHVLWSILVESHAPALPPIDQSKVTTKITSKMVLVLVIGIIILPTKTIWKIYPSLLHNRVHNRYTNITESGCKKCIMMERGNDGGPIWIMSIFQQCVSTLNRKLLGFIFSPNFSLLPSHSMAPQIQLKVCSYILNRCHKMIPNIMKHEPKHMEILYPTKIIWNVIESKSKSIQYNHKIIRNVFESKSKLIQHNHIR